MTYVLLILLGVSVGSLDGKTEPDAMSWHGREVVYHDPDAAKNCIAARDGLISKSKTMTIDAVCLPKETKK